MTTKGKNMTKGKSKIALRGAVTIRVVLGKRKLVLWEAEWDSVDASSLVLQPGDVLNIIIEEPDLPLIGTKFKLKAQKAASRRK
jgi:hypothetical protein